MITCDCCGHFIEHKEVIQRTKPGTQTKADPYGEREDWCPGCNEMLDKMEEGLHKKYRQDLHNAMTEAREALMRQMMKRS